MGIIVVVVNASGSVNTFALLTEMGVYHGSLLRNSASKRLRSIFGVASLI